MRTSGWKAERSTAHPYIASHRLGVPYSLIVIRPVITTSCASWQCWPVALQSVLVPHSLYLILLWGMLHFNFRLTNRM